MVIKIFKVKLAASLGMTNILILTILTATLKRFMDIGTFPPRLLVAKDIE
jgi:hypothetical protein